MSSKIILKEVSGYCPHLDDEHEILVEYHEFYVAGKPGYKITRTDCSYVEECTMREQCPIKANAPERPW